MIVTVDNVTVEGTEPEATLVLQAVITHLTNKLGRVPTQEEIDEKVAEYFDKESEKVDFEGLLAQITTEVSYLDGQITLYDSTIPTIDTMTTAQVRAVVKELAQTMRRVMVEQRAELKTWRYAIRRLT